MVTPSAAFWTGKRVFLTGHTGFKGSWMTMLLHRLGAQVTGYSLPEPVSTPSLFDLARLGELCDDVRGDIRDGSRLSGALIAAKPDVVIHMAAQPIVRLSYREPVETFATNVMGVVNLLDAARRAEGLSAVLSVTSDKCYENREQVWPYREGDAMGGADPYSASKGCAELVTSSYARSFFADGDCRVASVRAGNVIGGGDWAADRLIPDLVRAAVSGSQASIRNPASIRPWQHVLDPLAGYLLAAERQCAAAGSAPFDAWNFGPNPGEELPVSEVVEVFRATWNGRPDVVFGKAVEHEAGMLRVDSTKAKYELGWRPCTTNQGAVEAVVNWHRGEADGQDPRKLCFADIEHLLGVA